jgi:hypothetical protein
VRPISLPVHPVIAAPCRGRLDKQRATALPTVAVDDRLKQQIRVEYSRVKTLLRRQRTRKLVHKLLAVLAGKLESGQAEWPGVQSKTLCVALFGLQLLMV